MEASLNILVCRWICTFYLYIQSKIHFRWNDPFESISNTHSASCLWDHSHLEKFISPYCSKWIHSKFKCQVSVKSVGGFRPEGKILTYIKTLLSTIDMILNYLNGLFLSMSYPHVKIYWSKRKSIWRWNYFEHVQTSFILPKTRR